VMELEKGTSLSLSGHTLVLPSVSVGNVGQLAVDVILATIKPTLVSQVHQPSLIPLVGSDPLSDSGNTLTTAMQLYTTITESGLKLAVLQIRSGLLPGQGDSFILDLVSWCQEMQVERVVCLTSSHAHERLDQQLTGVPLRYLATTSLASTLPTTFIPLETREKLPSLGPGEEKEPDTEYIPGGGLARRLLVRCREKGQSALVLLKFCSEGDNTTDGLMVADYLNQYLAFTKEEVEKKQKYRVPPSWKHLFGPPAPVEMFW